jgi:hypothetical protein
VVGEEEELQAFYQVFRSHARNLELSPGTFEFVLDKLTIVHIFPQFRVKKTFTPLVHKILRYLLPLHPPFNSCSPETKDIFFKKIVLTLKDSRRLIKSLLTLFDYNVSPKTVRVAHYMTFEQFIVLTSTIARGNAEERAERMF